MEPMSREQQVRRRIAEAFERELSTFRFCKGMFQREHRDCGSVTTAIETTEHLRDVVLHYLDFEDAGAI